MIFLGFTRFLSKKWGFWGGSGWKSEDSCGEAFLLKKEEDREVTWRSFLGERWQFRGWG